MVTQHDDVVRAQPTKAFFVDMLVKDQSLPSAIMDLIDNCVDGAKRLRGDNPFDNLHVNVSISTEKFEVSDNCGGISNDLAKNYAFRFGRDVNAPALHGTVGLFGVGMKRAIFKLGREFEVRSTSEYGSFIVKVNVVDWLEVDTTPWTFPMKCTDYPQPNQENDRGTVVVVSKLFEGVASQFGESLFVTKLRAEIAARHQTYLEKGLRIVVNGTRVIPTTVTYAYIPGDLLPAHKSFRYDGVGVNLFAGIGKPDVNNAGWYVYCNGRMVVKGDQSDLTGWGELGTPKIPKYHHQFSRFRGSAYFESDDPTLLPWNTTKDRLDVEHKIYRSVKLEMVTAMRPVIDFLNRVDKELEERDEAKRVLTELVNRANYSAPTADLPTNEEFTYVKPEPRPKLPKYINILYSRPKEKVEALKKCLGVGSAKEAGEKTFDWYLKNECGYE
jgi:hypothetical protein